MPPNMCIVNEYQPGQGIMAHTDAPSLFGPIILSLSLLSSCLITFTHVIDPTNQFSVILRPRSLLMMTESCRFDYKHSISKDLVEFYGEEKIVRDRRVSLTFRTVISSNQDDINEVENEVLTQKKP
ncbi:hypothetical protein G9A89_012812 [Geosiphon pyriformis]|nr:hypothetical protein G9A89_012812 [Geosiphon pyriformis]